MRTVKEHDTRKTEIMDTAEELFISKGYDKTTINDILKRIGIAKGTFYHYFTSKEEVMEAVIMRIIDQDMVIATEIAADSNLGALDKISHYLFRQAAGNNDTKTLMLAEFPKVENALMKQRALEGTLAHICPILAKIVEEGNQNQEFNTTYPLVATQFLVAGIQSLSDDKTATPEEATQRLDAFIDIIYRVLGINEAISKEAVTKKFKKILTTS